MNLNKTEYSAKDEMEVSVDVSNTGKVDGCEVVQLYVSDLYCRISPLGKQLKKFERVFIPAGATKSIKFKLNVAELSFLNEKLLPEVEPGEFEMFLGRNCMEGVSQIFAVK